MRDELSPMLAGISCAQIVDAILRRHDHRSHITGLVSPTPGRVLFGLAATIQFVPMRRDLFDPVENDFGRLFYEAIGEDGRDKVLVMSSAGQPHMSLGGGRKLSRLDNNELQGLLCDGRLRDFAGLAEYGFTTYCSGESVRAGVDVIMPFAAGVPVPVGGVTVVPGDYVFADSSGAVVIPGAEVTDIIEDAVSVEERDAASVARIRLEDRETVMREGSPKP